MTMLRWIRGLFVATLLVVTAYAQESAPPAPESAAPSQPAVQAPVKSAPVKRPTKAKLRRTANRHSVRKGRHAAHRARHAARHGRKHRVARKGRHHAAPVVQQPMVPPSVTPNTQP